MGMASVDMMRLDSYAALDAWLDDRLDKDIQEQLGLLPSPTSTPWAAPVAAGLEGPLLPRHSMSPGALSPCFAIGATGDAVAYPEIALPSSGAQLQWCSMATQDSSHTFGSQQPTPAPGQPCSHVCMPGQASQQLTAPYMPPWARVQGTPAHVAGAPTHHTPPPGCEARVDLFSSSASRMFPTAVQDGPSGCTPIQAFPSRKVSLAPKQGPYQPSSRQQGMAAQVPAQDVQANVRLSYTLTSTSATHAAEAAAADAAGGPTTKPLPSSPSSMQQNRAGGAQSGGRRAGRGCRVSKGLTSSARYHAARRAGLAALEAAVSSKAAQVADLEAARGELARRAHVLETMVADADKLLAVLAARAPQGKAGPASQAEAVVELLTRGVPHSRGVPRPLHLMLDAGAALNPLSWPLQELLQRWRGYVGTLRPLLGLVAQARAALPPAPAAPAEGLARRCPRRAAAAAASRIAAMGQQLDEHASTTDEEGDGVAPAALGTPKVRRGGGSEDHGGPLSCCWPPAGEVDGRLVYGGPGTEGVPLELLAQVEALVLDNMAWLHVLATSTALHKHHFFAADFEGRGRLPPGRADAFWQTVVAAMQLTPTQRAECAASLAAATRCCTVMCADRQEIQEQLTATAASCSASSCDALARCAALEAAAAAAAGMERSLVREHITRHLVGMAQSNVLSLLQQAQGAVAAWPWFPGSWSVFEAAAAGLQEGHAQQPV